VTSDLLFSSLRSDWYASNTVLPRRFVRAIIGAQALRLVGFPAQWIPPCAHFGIEWSEATTPASYIPLFSDLNPHVVGELCKVATRKGTSRELVEATAALDPVIADFLYIVDHKLRAAGYRPDDTTASRISLNTWHSFGQPQVLELQERMCRHVSGADVFVMLPCSRHRPYDESRTHKRLSAALDALGYGNWDATRVVVTALGVVPEPFWNEPIVLRYDAGAVDLWRVFQLLRMFFSVNRARSVIDCLSFKPYSEMLSTLHSLGKVGDVIRPLKLRWRSFAVELS
jgi:hypothetical protein